MEIMLKLVVYKKFGDIVFIRYYCNLFMCLILVISVSEGDFFFDFVRYLTDWIRKVRFTRDGLCC